MHNLSTHPPSQTTDMKKRLIVFLFFWLLTSPLAAQESIKRIIGPELNGIKQRLIIQGKDDTKPLLLFLHGGPGFGSTGYAKKFVKVLKNEFIMVQWDQRHTGATKSWNPDNTPLSLELMQQDTEAVVNYLLTSFAREKIYSVGFSWGSFLGLHYAKNHPNTLHAYVSVSGLVNGNQSEKQILADLMAKARANKDQEALEALSSIKIPFEDAEDIYLQRKWTGEFFPESMENTRLKQSLVTNWAETWLPIFLEASSIDYGKTAASIDCPVYFFHSPLDRVAHHATARAYYEQLKAPKKVWISFPTAPHEIVSADPKEFANALRAVLN